MDDTSLNRSQARRENEHLAIRILLEQKKLRIVRKSLSVIHVDIYSRLAR